MNKNIVFYIKDIIKVHIFSTFTVANVLQDSLYKVINVGSEAIETVKDLNDATTSLRMATGESYSTITGFMSDYNQMAQELGSLTVAVEDVIGIVDKVSSIDMASATDAGGLMEAMSRTATTASMADVSMSKLLGYLATVGETTQKSMSSIGKSFKTIFTRMSDIKANKLELVDEDGTTELLSDVELTLQKVGIDLRKTVNEYNSYSDVLDSLAGKWDNLTEVQQNALSKAFAGTRQAENFRVLMENYEKVLKYTAIAEEADFLIELISDEKMFDDTGTITEHGQATLALHATNYNVYMSQAEEYQQALLQLNDELANDPNNQILLDRRNELLQLQRESILSAENEVQAIKDLKSQGYDALLSAMDKSIQKRKDALQQISDMRDYEKSITEQADEVARLEKITQSLQLDQSETGKAALQKYYIQLEQAKEDLQETQLDKMIEEETKRTKLVLLLLTKWISFGVTVVHLLLQWLCMVRDLVRN